MLIDLIKDVVGMEEGLVEEGGRIAVVLTFAYASDDLFNRVGIDDTTGFLEFFAQMVETAYVLRGEEQFGYIGIAFLGKALINISAQQALRLSDVLHVDDHIGLALNKDIATSDVDINVGHILFAVRELHADLEVTEIVFPLKRL